MLNILPYLELKVINKQMKTKKVASKVVERNYNLITDSYISTCVASLTESNLLNGTTKQSLVLVLKKQ